MFAKIDEHLLAGGTKSLDILVNNAGVGAEGDVETLREADFDRVFNTNVKGLLFVTQNAVPRMVRGGDRKSTRRTPVTNAHLVCRLLLEKKKTHITTT